MSLVIVGFAPAFPLQIAALAGLRQPCRAPMFVPAGRGTQAVRERSAKPLCVGSIPTRASILSMLAIGGTSLAQEIDFLAGSTPQVDHPREEYL
jgi:hypothetical protein